MKKLFLLMMLLTSATCWAQKGEDRGFIHPGGLHTQADFDRVKQLIKDKDERVVKAYNVLKSAAYSQSSVQTYPTETIVRGGGSGENYMNACRGAAMAYQNALRWKIDGTKANAEAAVKVLMAWARTTKYIGGDSNYALAAGLYGYEFAQAAELMRDYDGWSDADFQEFKRWMLKVWYPTSMGFLRGRNGTWENSGKWWQAPGHYWSNWGLCNALCIISIGVLCDDVYIYNQGMSFFKYDQVGNFSIPPTLHTVTGHSDFTGEAIWNDALTEFLGALVVTDVESSLETGAYGRLGQMQESGRDTGHSAMALGLAIDIAKVGWNQGDDLFAYMDHRLASGIEYVAAQTQNVEGLPWTPYQRCESGYYYSDYRSWVMQSPALGAQMRPYWGTVIGIYEGVKGVTMPFSELSYEQMGIDGGGQGSTSGGYDHLGYSVLMNTRVPQLCPADQVPTELSPMMECNTSVSSLIPSYAMETRIGNLSGKTVRHNELGGLINTYSTIGSAVPNGRTLTLKPQLPEGEEDTGLWQWNTGEQTREITVTTDKSYIYRVTYTNKNGIQSQLCFPIACQGDGPAVELIPTITYGDNVIEGDTVSVLYGDKVQLKASPLIGGGTWKWSTGATTESINSPAIKADRQISVTYKHTNGVTAQQVFRLGVHMCEPFIIIGSTQRNDSTAACASGASVSVGLRLPSAVDASSVAWSTGDVGDTLKLGNLETTTEVSATFQLAGVNYVQHFTVYVRESDTSRLIEPGNYVIQHTASGRLLTHHGQGELATFEEGDAENPTLSQAWFIDRRTTPKYCIMTLPDSLRLGTTAKTSATGSYTFSLWGAEGSEQVALYTGSTSSSMKFWNTDSEGNVVIATQSIVTAFPFRLIPIADDWDAVKPVTSNSPVIHQQWFTPDGRSAAPNHRGIVIVRQQHADGTVTIRKTTNR